MALHELATNAVKYGALSNGSGQVLVSWQREGNERLAFCWRERGGPPVCPPNRKGFGSRLIERAFAAQAGQAHFDFNPEGIVCSVNVGLLGDAA